MAQDQCAFMCECALWSAVPVCPHFFWLFCHCVHLRGNFYEAISALGMLWFPYNFYGVPCAAQLLKKASMQRLYSNIFYSAAFQMSLKIHFTREKKRGKLVLESVVISTGVWGWYLSVSRKYPRSIWLLVGQPNGGILYVRKGYNELHYLMAM